MLFGCKFHDIFFNYANLKGEINHIAASFDQNIGKSTLLLMLRPSFGHYILNINMRQMQRSPEPNQSILWSEILFTAFRRLFSMLERRRTPVSSSSKSAQMKCVVSGQMYRINRPSAALSKKFKFSSSAADVPVVKVFKQRRGCCSGEDRRRNTCLTIMTTPSPPFQQHPSA